MCKRIPKPTTSAIEEVATEAFDELAEDEKPVVAKKAPARKKKVGVDAVEEKVGVDAVEEKPKPARRGLARMMPPTVEL